MDSLTKLPLINEDGKALCICTACGGNGKQVLGSKMEGGDMKTKAFKVRGKNMAARHGWGDFQKITCQVCRGAGMIVSA